MIWSFRNEILQQQQEQKQTKINNKSNRNRKSKSNRNGKLNKSSNSNKKRRTNKPTATKAQPIEESTVEELEQLASSRITCSKSEVTLLKAYDLERIREVREAMSVYRNEENRVEVVGAAQSLIEVANLAEAYVKKAIKFCKCFSSFKSLNPLDQMLLLKYSFPEVASVYIAFLYLPNKDGFNALMVSEILIEKYYFFIHKIPNRMTKETRQCLSRWTFPLSSSGRTYRRDFVNFPS